MAGNALASVVAIAKGSRQPQPAQAPSAPPAPVYGVKLAKPAYIALTHAEQLIFEDLCASLPAHLHAQIDAAAVCELAQVIREMESLARFVKKHSAFEKVVTGHGDIRVVERAQGKRLNSLSKRRARLMDQLGLSTPKRKRLAPDSSRPKRGVDRWGGV